MTLKEIDQQITKFLFDLDLPDCAFIPSYTSDHKYIGIILEKLRLMGCSTDILYDTADGKPNVLVVIIKYDLMGESYIGEEETLPLALCKAIIKFSKGEHND